MTCSNHLYSESLLRKLIRDFISVSYKIAIRPEIYELKLNFLESFKYSHIYHTMFHENPHNSF